MPTTEKIRLDIYLHQHEMVRSRNEAQEIIKQNFVKVNGKICNSSSKKVNGDYKIEIIQNKKYVSRAGYKLEYAIDKCKKEFELNIKDKNCLDIGSSTGGFTEVLLENNAKNIIAIDVGTKQFDTKLLQNNQDKIKLFENTDIRNVGDRFIKENKLEEYLPTDFIVCDLSFISVRLVLDKIMELLKDDGQVMMLIKPQFEVGPGGTRHGIVTDAELRDDSVAARITDIEEAGFYIIDSFESAVLGGEGNREYFVFFRKA